MNTEHPKIQFTISPTTNSVLSCLKAQSDLYSIISDAVREAYGEIQVDKMMDDMFYKPLSDVRNQIFELLKGSVEDSLGTIGSTQI